MWDVKNIALFSPINQVLRWMEGGGVHGMELHAWKETKFVAFWKAEQSSREAFSTLVNSGKDS